MKEKELPDEGVLSLSKHPAGRRLFEAHFGASPHAPLKELFEKSSLRNLKNFSLLEVADVIRKHIRHMLTSSLRHMQAIGHTLGVEGIKLWIVVEIHWFDALASADLDECKVEILMLKTVRALIGVFFLSH